MGGVNNSLAFSYPFWYINALPLCLLLVSIVKSQFDKCSFCILGLMAFIMYAVVHLVDIPAVTPLRLPFSIDAAIGCFPYLFCGYALKKIEFKWKYLAFLVIPVVMICLKFSGLIGYELDMKQMKYTSWVLDFIVPISFAISLYGVSMLISKIAFLRHFLSPLGESCITVYFIHATVIYLAGARIHPILVVVLSVVLGYVIHELFKKNTWTSKLFLGVK